MPTKSAKLYDMDVWKDDPNFRKVLITENVHNVLRSIVDYLKVLCK